MSDERPVQEEPLVLEGEDELPRQPSSRRDPFVPEPYARPGERRAWRLMRAIVAVAGVFAMLVLVLPVPA